MQLIELILCDWCQLFKILTPPCLDPLFIICFFPSWPLQKGRVKDQSGGPRTPKNCSFWSRSPARYSWLVNYRHSHQYLNLFYHFGLLSGSKLAGEEILRRLPCAGQTPALVHLWPPLLATHRAAQIRLSERHGRGTVYRLFLSPCDICEHTPGQSSETSHKPFKINFYPERSFLSFMWWNKCWPMGVFYFRKIDAQPQANTCLPFSIRS